jgi:hypothetical protein
MITPNELSKAAILKIVKSFSDTFFKSELPLPAVRIKGKNRFSMRFFPKSFELVIGTLLPNQKPIQILDEAIHQCCHIYNYTKDIKDLPNHHYHNKKFAEVVIKCGMVVTRDPNFGWISCSDPIQFNIKCINFLTKGKCPCGKNCVQFPNKKSVLKRESIYAELIEKIDFCVFSGIKFKETGKQYFLKYTCGCEPPYNSIRSGRRPEGKRAIQIRCEICKQLFTYVG